MPGGCSSFVFTAEASDHEDCELTYHFSSNGTLCEGENEISVYATDPYGAATETVSFTFTVLPEENLSPIAVIEGNELEYQIENDCVDGGSVEIDSISGFGADLMRRIFLTVSGHHATRLLKLIMQIQQTQL